MGSIVSAIPFTLYQEIMNEIQPCEIEDIDVTIHLANKQSISLVGIVRDVAVLCGKIKYPTDFLVLGSVQDSFCPIIFGRPFLSTCGAIIDCKKGKVSIEFNGESYEFIFLSFLSSLVVLICQVMTKLLKKLLLLLFLLMILCSNLWKTTRMIYICRRGMS